MSTTLRLLGAAATLVGASLASAAPSPATIPGYSYGSPTLTRSSVSLADFGNRRAVPEKERRLARGCRQDNGGVEQDGHATGDPVDAALYQARSVLNR